MWSSISQRDPSFHHAGDAHWQCVSGDNKQKLLLLFVVFHSSNQASVLEELVEPIQTKDCHLIISHSYWPSNSIPNGNVPYYILDIHCFLSVYFNNLLMLVILLSVYPSSKSGNQQYKSLRSSNFSGSQMKKTLKREI